MDVLAQGPTVMRASKALVLLHGRAASAHSIIGLADLLGDTDTLAIAPNAPHGSWYPYSFMEKDSLNEPDLSQSVALVKKVVDELAEHLPLNRIFLLGFSQGACLSLEVAARFATRYGGVVAFTGGLIGSRIDERRYTGNFAGAPIFIGTSDVDPHVPLTRVEESKHVLEKMGAKVALHVYPHMGHTINKEEIAYVKNMLSVDFYKKL